MKVWALIFIIYTAPNDSINWDGPWEAGMIFSEEKSITSEQECQKKAKYIIDKMQQGMHAPMLFKCIPFDRSIP